MFGKREILIATLGLGLLLACLYAAGCVPRPSTASLGHWLWCRELGTKR